MSNVIPKAGQCWQSKSVLDFEGLPRGEFKIIEVNHSAILLKLLKFDYIITVDARTFHSGYEFTPIGDLQWLAVEVDLESFSSFVKYVSKYRNILRFLKLGLEHLVIDGFFEGDKHYTRDQLQNERYDLGLDEKPTIHTELTGRICEGFPRPSEDLSRLMSFRCIATPVLANQKETEMSTKEMLPISYVKIVINDDLEPLKPSIKYVTASGAELERLDNGEFVVIKGRVSEGDLIMQKQDKPVFTQAMQDAGINPKAGSKVLYDGEGYTFVEFFFIGVSPVDGLLLIEPVDRNDRNSLFRVKLNEIKPIQTAEDKSMDDLQSMYGRSAGQYNTADRVNASDYLADIKAGKVRGAKWVDE